MERVNTVLTFAVADSLFAVEVGIVQEILSPQKPSRLPKAPPYLQGLIDVRGTSVALVDLRCLLDEESRPDDEDTRIMLLCFEADGERHYIALRVDRVIEVAQLDDDGHVAPLSEAKMLDWDPRMLLGIGRRDGVITALLDIRAIFDPTIMAATRTRNNLGGTTPCPS
ncbi:MAG: chemotaxis protein CheW [Rhodobacteraceae bacterium]|nr:chemotaxis protein CheW [Paracoccaceae bacterium]MAY46798.1 chemotaxis protein CheW [Paracoccaceae bacterium]